MKKWVVILIIILGVGFDQLSKGMVYQRLYIDQKPDKVLISFDVDDKPFNLLTITCTFNTGVAFGMFSDEDEEVQQPAVLLPGAMQENDQEIDQVEESKSWKFYMRNILFGVLTIAAIFIVRYFYKSVYDEYKTVKVCLILIVTGAVGNFMDRIFGYILYEGKFKLFFGGVVDFIKVKITNDFDWFTFNLADAYISVGVVLLLLILIIKRKEKIFKEEDKKKQKA